MTVVRLALGCDYDRLAYLANYDVLLRQILGLAPMLSDQEKIFHEKTLSQNVCHVDEEVLREINTLVAQAGRAVFKKKTVPLSRSAPRPTATCWKPTCIFRPT